MKKKVPQIGFSAFLRLLNARDKPQRDAIKSRYKPQGGGRNFHRSFHLSVRKMLIGQATFKDLVRASRKIKKPSERRYVKFGLVRFLRWYIALGNRASAYPAISLSSPQGFFEVQFAPDCIVTLNGRRTAIHLWNSKEKINRDQALAALTLVAAKFPLTLDRPDDFAVLSLKDRDIYKWSDATKEHKKLALDLMVHLDKLFTIIRSELGLPPLGDRPSDNSHPYL